MARVIAIFNQKGGVGKTTTSLGLASYLAMSGERTLLVDLDPQFNATVGTGVRHAADETIYHALFSGVPAARVVKPTFLSNFDIIPASQDLAGALVELVPLEGRESYLRSFLAPLRDAYCFILIDMGPSLNLLTVNGLMAADEVIIPIQCEYYSLEGLSQLLATLELIRTNLGHPVTVGGILLTMYDKREKLSREVAREIRRRAPFPVYDVEIPRAVALAEAPSVQKPIALYAPQSPGALAYERLAREVISQQAANTMPALPPVPHVSLDEAGDSVRAVVVERGEVLLVKRVRHDEAFWVFPGGHIEAGETAHAALVREVREEADIDIRPVDVLASDRTADGSFTRWYVCERVSGLPGPGNGPEFNGDPVYRNRGTYEVQSVPVGELAGLNVVPHRIRDLVIEQFHVPTDDTIASTESPPLMS
ncbi:MAG: AAA family ATPase [bacterium]|nr:AAA family ATPase [bacterium]